jgi:hypothetical protein
VLLTGQAQLARNPHLRLSESAEAEQDAPVWFDNGESVQALARTARVLVQYVHVDLTTGTTEHRTVDGREGAAV